MQHQCNVHGSRVDVQRGVWDCHSWMDTHPVVTSTHAHARQACVLTRQLLLYVWPFDPHTGDSADPAHDATHELRVGWDVGDCAEPPRAMSTAATAAARARIPSVSSVCWKEYCARPNWRADSVSLVIGPIPAENINSSHNFDSSSHHHHFFHVLACQFTINTDRNGPTVDGRPLTAVGLHIDHDHAREHLRAL